MTTACAHVDVDKSRRYFIIFFIHSHTHLCIWENIQFRFFSACNRRLNSAVNAKSVGRPSGVLHVRPIARGSSVIYTNKLNTRMTPLTRTRCGSIQKRHNRFDNKSPQDRITL